MHNPPSRRRSDCRICRSSSFEIYEARSRNSSPFANESKRFLSSSDDRLSDNSDVDVSDEGSTYPREVVRMPTPPPIVKRIVERVPTPEAYIIERQLVIYFVPDKYVTSDIFDYQVS
ncbi:hypothetical protein GJ496_005528 [Pomphorhynchus laevis]|nr:hypothetical protein GJ496_005528 [Pomphorhynchus laevis]